jgi:hypothetical protein
MQILPRMRAIETDKTSPSSRGLGHRPFTAVTGVRIPLGIPYFFGRLVSVRSLLNVCAEIAQLVEHNLAKVGVGSSSLLFRSK